MVLLRKDILTQGPFSWWQMQLWWKEVIVCICSKQLGNETKITITLLLLGHPTEGRRCCKDNAVWNQSLHSEHNGTPKCRQFESSNSIRKRWSWWMEHDAESWVLQMHCCPMQCTVHNKQAYLCKLAAMSLLLSWYMSSKPRLMSSPAASVSRLNCLSFSSLSAGELMLNQLWMLCVIRSSASHTLTCLLFIGVVCLAFPAVYKTRVSLVDSVDFEFTLSTRRCIAAYLADALVFLLPAAFLAGGFKRLRALHGRRSGVGHV